MPAMAAPDLSAGSASGMPGQSVNIPVRIDTDGSVVALQLDLSYDPALLSTAGISAGAALTDHTFDWSEVSPGKLRLVFTSATQAALQDGELAVLTLVIDKAAPTGTIPLVLDGIVQADASGALVAPTSQTDGSVEVYEVNIIPVLSPLGVVLLVAVLLLGSWVFHQRGLIGVSFSVLLSMVLFSSTIVRAANPAGDANNDGVVDASDIPVIVAQILEHGPAPGDPDCNADLVVDVRDTICVTLAPDNQSPDLIPPGSRLIQTDKLFQTPLFATDPDIGDVLTFDLDSAPAGMSIDPVTGMLSWTPDGTDLGGNAVTATVTDSGGLTDSEIFDVEVFEPVVLAAANEPPSLTVPGKQTIVFDNLLSVGASATDDDGDTPAFALVNAPAGMTINSVSGAITWIPAEAQIGPHDVTVKASDPHGGADFGSFIVMVMDVNKTPVANDDVYEARLGVPLMIDLPGVLGNDTDPNGDALTSVLVGDAGVGDLTLNDDGSFEYLLVPPDPTTLVELELLCDNAMNPGSLGSDSAIDSEYQSNETLMVGDVDNDGDLEIVGTANLSGRTFQLELWIMNAADCTEQSEIAFEQSGTFDMTSHLALHDIDGDGDLEIIGSRERYPDDPDGSGGPFDGEHLLAIHHDGTLAWPGDGGSETSTIFTDNVAQNGYRGQGPTFVDLEGDGTIEIVMASSIGFNHNTQSMVVVYNAVDGSIKWEYLSDVIQSDHNAPRMPYVVDLDLDGTMEIIVHNSVIDHMGELEFTLPSLVATGTTSEGHLTLGIGNFDDDAYPELVGRDNHNFYLFEHDGTKTWEFASRNTAESQIAVADFDGDGDLEFAHSGCTSYTFNCNTQAIQVFNTESSTDCTDDCTAGDFLLWDHHDQPDFHVGSVLDRRENITAFDVNRDGAFDLLFRIDAANIFYIFDGRDGSVLTSVPAGDYTIDQRFVTVVDVNGDGHAELINSHTNGLVGQTEIWTGTAANPLPKAPAYRHQWNFHEAYVNDDLTIPTAPVPHWLRPGLNGYHIIMPEPHPLVGADDSFTYKANDGALDSNIATVTLDILPAGNPPQFLSEPDVLTTRGFPYNYAPIVVDPDLGDTVTFQLMAAPAGMTINPATGEINWLPDTNGTYPVTIMVSNAIMVTG